MQKLREHLAAPMKQKFNNSILGLWRINRINEEETKTRSENRSLFLLPREVGVPYNISELAKCWSWHGSQFICMFRLFLLVFCEAVK